MSPAEYRDIPLDVDLVLRQLPEAADRSLPADCLARHRAELMRQIRADLARTATAAPRGRPVTRRVAAPVLAAVTVAAVVAGAALVRTHGGGARPVPLVAVQPGSAHQAAATLGEMADAAQVLPAVPIASGQYVYVKTISQYAQEYTTPWTLMPITTRETWYAQAPGVQRGMYREDGHDTQVVAAVPAGQASPSPLDGPTQAWAAGLPDDPGSLLQVVRGALYQDFEYPDNVREFLAIGDILSETVPPPHTQAALYRAAALIPGVQMVADATDAAGRHGFGIAIEDTLGERHEWIFARGTYRFLGERDYLTENTAGGEAGMLVGVTAVLAKGVTNAEGGQPPATLD